MREPHRLPDVLRQVAYMGRRLSDSERSARRRQAENERRRRAAEVEERRREMAKRMESMIRRARNAAQAEFADWRNSEEVLARLSAPENPIQGARQRLERQIVRRPFNQTQFVPEKFEIGWFDFYKPAGPLAPIVDRVRLEAQNWLEEEFTRSPGGGRLAHLSRNSEAVWYGEKGNFWNRSPLRACASQVQMSSRGRRRNGVPSSWD